ncbi:hypothetical protein E8E13_009862 [Curvularia kusanoi]|uniref:DUF6536 domain-containing protein n=1 Tax=Curvularia kusanoi TaxID=90978 RepID=A0A9P4WBL5_CURKU|nr:hypothetical protein E8E13_009862 [Curvularia kusanoi]
MVLKRALTRYRRVQEDSCHGLDADDIELLQDSQEISRAYHPAYDFENFPAPDHNELLPGHDRNQAQKPFRVFQLSSWRAIQKGQFTGWRMGVLVALIGTTLVCLFNVMVTIYILWQGKAKNGYGTLYEGNCQKARDLNVWVHLVVNVLSTLLLGASNYCMHVLSSPTRDELANDYSIIPATEPWIRGASYDNSSIVKITIGNIEWDLSSWQLQNTTRPEWYTTDGAYEAKYANLSTEDCFNAYGTQYLSKLGNVYIVQDGPKILSLDVQDTWRDFISFNSSSLKSEPEIYPSNGWRCQSWSITCDISNTNEVAADQSKWEPFQRPVKYCLAEEVNERCSLNFSTSIAIIVILSNMIKVLCMSLTLHRYRQHEPLVTLGDAIVNFLNHPDPQTKGRCLYTRGAYETQWNWERYNNVQKDALGVDPEGYNPEHRRWSAAPSRTRWWVTYILFAIAVIFGAVCMALSLKGMPSDFKGLWAIGFGQITGQNLLSLDNSFAGGVMIANLPQVMLSYLYLTFNALCTTMFMAREWSTYACTRKPLRVTAPVGEQRSTYWLNMPFRYGIPMQVMALLFHWLTSQSIFLVRMIVLDARSREPNRIISTNGFSPVAIILATCLGILIAIIGFVIGRLRFSSAMPVAASCSAVISAACHPLIEDTSASVKAVQWGAVTHGQRRGVSKSEDLVGHCTFSSLPVVEPMIGHSYA